MRTLILAIVLMLALSTRVWAVVGDVYGVEGVGGTYIVEVQKVKENYAGNIDVQYSVTTPSGGIYTVTTTLLDI
jgi:hypothetical protein